MFHQRDTFDLKVHFVGVIARFGLFVCTFEFFIIIPMVCQRMSVPTAHFPSTELRSAVLFCLNESFRINLFPKTPSQTQKSAIIVAKSCRRSSVRTCDVLYGCGQHTKMIGNVECVCVIYPSVTRFVYFQP